MCKLSSILLTLLVAGALSLVSAQTQPPPRKKNAPVTPAAPEEDASKQEQVLSLETNQVVLNVTVTDAADNYVPGLTAKNFRLLEDHVQQKIVSFGFEETPFAAVILLDTSGSMGTKMSFARAACSRFTAGIREGDNVAIYKFSGTKVKMLQDFSEIRDVDPIVWDTDADGETPLFDAVVTASEALAKRPETRRAILIISDGADTNSAASFEKALRVAGDAQVTIYTVDLSDSALTKGVNRDQGSRTLSDFAVKSGGRFFSTPGGGKLRDAFEQTVEELRHQYTIVYEPTNDKQDGKWRTIDLTVNSPVYKVRTRLGYYAKKPDRRSAGEAKSHN